MNTNEAIAFITEYLPLRLCNLCEVNGESVSLWCPFDKTTADSKDSAQLKLIIGKDYRLAEVTDMVRKIRKELQI